MTAAVVLIAAAAARASETHDLQLWAAASISGSVTENLTLSHVEWYRFRNEITDYFALHAETTVAWKAAPWLGWDLRYRAISERSRAVPRNREKWYEESRVTTAGTLSLPAGPVVLSEVLRVERRMRPGRDTHWRYRSRTNVETSLSCLGLPVTPYLSAEFMGRDDKPGLQTFRAYAGGTVKLGKHFAQEACAFREYGRAGAAWPFFNAILVVTKVKL